MKGKENRSRSMVRSPLKHKCQTKQSVTKILKMEQQDSPTRAETQRPDITVWPNKVVSYLNFKIDQQDSPTRAETQRPDNTIWSDNRFQQRLF